MKSPLGTVCLLLSNPPPPAPGDRLKAGTYWALNPAALAARSGAHQLWGLSLPCPIAQPYRLSLHLGSDHLAEPDCFFYVELFELPLCGGKPAAGVGVRERALRLKVETQC